MFVGIIVNPQTDETHIRPIKHKAAHCELTKKDAGYHPYRVWTLANNIITVLYFTPCFTFCYVLSLCYPGQSPHFYGVERDRVSSRNQRKDLMKLRGEFEWQILSGLEPQFLANSDLLDSAMCKDRFTMGFVWRRQIVPGQHLALHTTLILPLPHPVFTVPLTQT